jgi:hypothetical protein
MRNVNTLSFIWLNNKPQHNCSMGNTTITRSQEADYPYTTYKDEGFMK